MLLNQSNFSAGEVGPELYGRVDAELYSAALRTCLNFLVRQHGGVSNRPGTQFVAEVKDHSRKVRLVPFQFNEEQTYALEEGNQYQRVIKDGGEVVEGAKTIVSFTSGVYSNIGCPAHGFSNDEDVYLTDILGTVELNGRTVRVADVTADNFNLKDFQGNYVDSTGYAAYISGGTAARVYTLATPYAEADLFDLNYAQSNDVLTVVHQAYFPRDITRTDHDVWTVTSFANRGGPFKDINITSARVYADATTGIANIVADAPIFNAGMVGELFYIEQMPNDATAIWEPGKVIAVGDIRRAGEHYYKATTAATTGTLRPDHTEGTSSDGNTGVIWEYLHSGYGIVKFTTFTNNMQMTATVEITLPDNVNGAGNTTNIWAFSAWGVTDGYPSAVAYHDERLWFGGTLAVPNALSASTVAERLNFGQSPTLLDSDAISLKLSGNKPRNIRHLLPFNQLICLTSSSEHPIGTVDGGILATQPVSAKPGGYTGSAKVVPVVIGDNALFIQDLGRTVHSLKYSLESGGFSSGTLSSRSPHLFRGRSVSDWAYQREPLSVVWTVMDDGGLLGFTFMDEEKVYAWHRHKSETLAGISEFESVCSIREGNESAVYFVVKRVVNGNTVRYIERLASRELLFENEEDRTPLNQYHTIRECVFLDSSLSFDGRNFSDTTITISGGTTWDDADTVTLTTSAALFQAVDVGNEIHIPYESVENEGKYNQRRSLVILKLTINAYTSPTVVSAVPQSLVPVDRTTLKGELISYRNTARLDWEFARDTFRPLQHLEGEDVSILADGNVDSGIVDNGTISLGYCAALVHIGLPITARLQTLDIAQPTQQGSLKAHVLTVPSVFLTVQETRNVKVGVDGWDNMETRATRDDADDYISAPVETATIQVLTNSLWSRTGRICIEQTEPLPTSVNCITPEIKLGST